MKNINNNKLMSKIINKTKIENNFSLVFASNKGITLIALVITIILLIILAGISINLALGDDGLITKAREQQKRQDIVRISEELEVEKASAATENLRGIVLIDEYIDYIKQKNIITQGDIERISEADAYITVENYIFLLEQEENNNLKITYQEEASERKPKIESIDISNTTNTISLTINTKHANNGTYKYYIKNTENGEYEEKSSIKNNQYVYENLEQNKKHYIKVVVIATNNQTAEEEILRTTGTVEGLTDTNTTFTYSPDGWTNGNVTATARTEVTGYTLQTSKNGKDWTNTSSQTFSENGTIYARVVDNIGQATGYATGNVEKIDKTNPENATIALNSDIEGNQYHIHTGSSSTGGGCYGTPIYKTATGSRICGRFNMILNSTLGDGTSHWRCDTCGAITYQSGNNDPGDHYTTYTYNTTTIDHYELSCGKTEGEKEAYTIENLQLDATVTHKDNQSGVKIESCKWITNTSSTALGTDISHYTEGTFNDNKETITLNISTAGTYYIHVLTTDNVGNKTETIKGPITIEANYHAHKGSSSTGGGCYTKAVYKKATGTRACGTWYCILHAAQGDGTSHWKCTGCGEITYQSGDHNPGTHYVSYTYDTTTVDHYEINCGKSTTVIEGYTVTY